MKMTGQPAAHWDAAYAHGDDTRSWFEGHPGMSLRMLDAAGVSAADAVIDVGGGASPLAGALLDRGFGDLTVLDISAAGMQYARDRLGARAGQVRWLAADVLSWRPWRHYRAWHDRAVFHFLTAAEDRRQYLRVLDAATVPGAVSVFGCFAPDGPHHCSGLPVARYSPAQLARQIGAKWLLISQDREEHITPAGTTQPFTWITLRRQPWGLGAPAPSGRPG
jgi:trans-aconitate methyltransferase